MRFAPALLLGLNMLCLTVAPLAQTPDTVFLEELTWTEVRDKLAAGVTTVIIPTGGTEQNGPHMVLGKHNYLVRHKAGEGGPGGLATRWWRPSWLMCLREASIRRAATCAFPARSRRRPRCFEQVLEYAARSLRQHGFVDIALMGDSGGNQASQAAVAERLNEEEWADSPARVHHLTDYYPGPGDEWLIAQG